MTVAEGNSGTNNANFTVSCPAHRPHRSPSPPSSGTATAKPTTATSKKRPRRASPLNKSRGQGHQQRHHRRTKPSPSPLQPTSHLQSHAAAATITNDDVAIIRQQFGVHVVTKVERQRRAATFTVTLSRTSLNGWTVKFDSPAGRHLEPSPACGHLRESGTPAFAPGRLPKTIKHPFGDSTRPAAERQRRRKPTNLRSTAQPSPTTNPPYHRFRPRR